MGYGVWSETEQCSMWRRKQRTRRRSPETNVGIHCASVRQNRQMKTGARGQREMRCCFEHRISEN
jgi:hypothetical protein